MHTIKVDNWYMHFNSDLSGSIKLENDAVRFEVPGELVRQYIRRYVLGSLRSEQADLLARMVYEYGGANHPDAVRVMDGIDSLAPTADSPNGEVLTGTAYIVGEAMHFTAVKVDSDGVAINENWKDEVEAAELLCNTGPFQTTQIPGYEGDYVIYLVPHGR